MREILFRGKRLDNGEWVEGMYYESKVSGVFILAPYIKVRKKDGVVIGDDFVEHEVDPSTVGQYTGLTDKNDKNGKKIFEGDIIECWSEGVKARGAVQQNRGGLWIIYPAWQKHIMWGLCPNEDGSTDVEVIGNIHDNPELVEGKG